MTANDRPGRELGKDFLKVARELVDNQGWRYQFGKGHPKLFPADRTYPPIVFPTTASDHRAFKNFTAMVRRCGGKV
jgi:hypothetical protein